VLFRSGQRLGDSAGEVVETAKVDPGHPFATRTFDEPTVVSVAAGEVALLVGGENPAFPLREGESILVPAGCLHGVRAKTHAEWSRSTAEA